MYHFAAAQHISTAKLPGFFWRIQKEELDLSVNKTKITDKNTFNEGYFRIQGNHGQVKTKKVCLGYFCRVLTSALSLRSRKIYFYVFLSLFAF